VQGGHTKKVQEARECEKERGLFVCVCHVAVGQRVTRCAKDLGINENKNKKPSLVKTSRETKKKGRKKKKEKVSKASVRHQRKQERTANQRSLSKNRINEERM
tara:strand:- start:145 stop:453 length:309 start_codon:yes stop_codon:yes gene_type:complete